MPAVLPADRLVWGIQLPIQSQSTMYAEGWEAAAGADELAAVARAAEAAGAWYLAVCDHVAVPRHRADAMSTVWWDTVVTLGWLAGITERVRLLSHVYVPALRHPLLAAKAFATLDVVSGGRVVLGVGAGHVVEEFAALGVDFSARGRLLDAAIDDLRRAFTDEWWAGDIGQRPRPVQDGGPPIWVGGSSEPALRRAAERGDGWLPQGPITSKIVSELRSATGDRPFDVGALAGAVYVGQPGWDVGGPCLSGSPERIADVLRRFGELGAGQVQVRFPSRSADELCDQLTRFGAEVEPLFSTQ